MVKAADILKLALTQIKDKVTSINDMHLDRFVFMLLNSYELTIINNIRP
jgi:hypothetical protein